MPPIPVYADKPLHGKDVAPQTASDEARDPKPPNLETPTKTKDLETATSTARDQPPPPQPGARPTPTGATKASSSGPPPPQPSGNGRPAVTETHITTQTTRLPPPQAPPSQFSIPTPGESYLPTRSTHAELPPQRQQQHLVASLPKTSSAETDPANDPGRKDDGNMRQSLEHPPNYLQNNQYSGQLASGARMNNMSDHDDQAEGGVWGDVKNWVGGVGEKAAEVEAEAWKWVKNH